MEEKGIAMLLLTPERIRTLQRKLYVKAKQDPSIVTCPIVECAGAISSVALTNIEGAMCMP